MEPRLDTFRSSTWGWLRGTIAGWVTLLFCLLGIGLIVVAMIWLWNMMAKYEITEERLIIRRGIFVKSVDEIELYRVKDIRLDFTLVNQWANIGTISVSSSDETTRGGDLVMPHIHDAARRREELRVLVDKARQKRRVREIDTVHDDFI